MPRITVAKYTQPIYVAATERALVDHRIHKATDYGILNILNAMLGGDHIASQPASEPVKNRIVRFVLHCGDKIITAAEQMQALPETLPELSERDMHIIAACLDCGFEYRLTPYTDEAFAETVNEWNSNNPLDKLNQYTLSFRIEVMEQE